MGLDSVEIVMGWEEEFGIAIPDEDAQKIFTPRQATDYVFGRVRQQAATECIRQQAFFRLRRGLGESKADLRSRVSPDTLLRNLVTRREWLAVWQDLRRRDFAGSWPERPPFGGPIAFRRRTIGDVVQHLAAADPRATPDRDSGWTREQVSLRIRHVVGEVVGLSAFGEDDEFVADLGVQ